MNIDWERHSSAFVGNAVFGVIHTNCLAVWQKVATFAYIHNTYDRLD